MCWKQKNHHSSRIICILFLYCFWKILMPVLRPMVKYGLADSRSPCAYLRDWDSPQATTLMAWQLGPSGLRLKMASSSRKKQVDTSNFLTLIQNPERVDLDINCYSFAMLRTGRWTIWMFKINRVKPLVIFIFLKI